MPRPKWPCASPCARRRSASFCSLQKCQPSCHVYGPLSVHLPCQAPAGPAAVPVGHLAVLALDAAFLTGLRRGRGAGRAAGGRAWLCVGQPLHGVPTLCFCGLAPRCYVSAVRERVASGAWRTICGALRLSRGNVQAQTAASVFMCASPADFCGRRYLQYALVTALVARLVRTHRSTTSVTQRIDCA